MSTKVVQDPLSAATHVMGLAGRRQPDAYVRLDICHARHRLSLYGSGRQTTRVAARRGENAAVLGGRAVGGRCAASTPPGRREAVDAAFAADAGDWPRCHELRVVDEEKTWRIMHRIDPDAIVIADVFQKTTQQTPARVIANCKRRLRLYDQLSRED